MILHEIKNLVINGYIDLLLNYQINLLNNSVCQVLVYSTWQTEFLCQVLPFHIGRVKLDFF